MELSASLASGGRWIALGALLCAAAIGAGAFGAHGLASRLDTRSLELWETAARYLMYGGLGLCVVGVTGAFAPGRLLTAAGLSLTFGSLVFSGTVAALALGAPRWLGAVTPLGGLGLIAGYLLLALAALKGG
jgi:uncharacterized membrane protein YgdD (TMEM256/DUF423 family)